MDIKLIKGIENLLFECQEKGLIYSTKDDTKDRIKLITAAQQLGLIQRISQGIYELSSLGVEANSKGGYEKYRVMIEVDEKMDKKIKELQLTQLKLNIFHLKYWWVILIASGIISFVVAYFTK